MRNHQLITTFKSGKMSPRLLGRRDVDAVKSACLELENGIVNLDGSVSSRKGFRYIAEIGNSEIFVARFSGEEYAITLSNTELYGTSNFIKIFKSDTMTDVSALVRNYAWSAFLNYKHVDFGSRWSSTTYTPALGGGIVGTGLKTLTQDIIKGPYTQMVQLTDNTILLTGANSCPLYITKYNDYFYTYPIFVNFIQYINNQVANLSGGAQYIEVQPHTVAYAEENTIAESSHRIRIINQNLYAGTALTTDTRIKTGDLFVYTVLLPNSAGNAFDGVTANDLKGRILRVTNPNNTESAYLLIKQDTYTSAGYLSMVGIRLIGGTMGVSSTEHETTLWRMSSWGNLQFPKVCNQYKGRSFLANTKLQPDTMWAAAINTKDAFNLGTFSQTVLKQDTSTDVSGLKYYNSTVLEGLAYELGLADGEAEEIMWMASRRRIHVGTTNGEFQLTSNATFTYTNIEVVKIGSNCSEYVQPASGDRKLVYLTSNGYMRGISVEDKNYESEDINISAVIGPLELQNRVTWNHSSNALCYGNRIIVLDDELKLASFSDVIIGNGVKPLLVGGKERIYGRLTVGSASVLIATNLGEEEDDSSYALEKTYDTMNTLTLPLYIGETIMYIREPIVDPDSFFTIGYNYSIVEIPSDWDGVTDIVPSGWEPYNPINFRLKSFPIEDNYPFGSSVGVISRWDKATVQYIDSGKFYVGSEDTNLLPVEGITDADLKTGQATIDFPNSPNRQNHIIIESTNPITISGVCMRGVVYGED